MNVGVSTDLPGLGEQDEGTNLRRGFDVDLFRWLGRHLRPEFTPVPVDTLIKDRVDALMSGEVDVVVEVLSITDERRKYVDLAGPYMITQQGVMVRSGDNRIRDIDGLPGKTVCTPAGSTSLEQFRSLADRITIVQVTGVSECVNRLAKNQVDAVSTDQLILYGFELNSGGSYSVLPDLTFGAQERYGVGLRLNSEMCNEVTNAISDFIINGAWDQFFSTNFPGLSSKGYKPDPYNLDPC
ncbi:MAG: transporter substrate-binding domain-containing protein [Pseudonocardiaceae bacterium]